MSILLRPAAAQPVGMPRPQSGTDIRLLCSYPGIYGLLIKVYFIYQLSKSSIT